MHSLHLRRDVPLVGSVVGVKVLLFAVFSLLLVYASVREYVGKGLPDSIMWSFEVFFFRDCA
jgi:hypothetical protein